MQLQLEKGHVAGPCLRTECIGAMAAQPLDEPAGPKDGNGRAG